MGSIRADEVVLGVGPTEYESRPVGSIDVVQPLTVTLVHRDESVPGHFVFGTQHLCACANTIRSYEAENPELTVRRLEVKCPADDGELQAGSILVCTEHPYSPFWAAMVPFRRSFRGRLQDLKPLGTRDELKGALAEATVDWWEKDDRLTAAIEEHDFHQVFAHRRRHTWEGRKLVFGALPATSANWNRDRESIETELLSSEGVQKLIRQAIRGRLLVGRGSRYATGDAESAAVSLAWFCTRQALAGPREDCETWVGQPVVKLIAQIYRDNMNVVSGTPREFSPAHHVALDSPLLIERDERQAQQFWNEWAAIGRDEEP